MLRVKSQLDNVLEVVQHINTKNQKFSEKITKLANNNPEVIKALQESGYYYQV
jgi:uncharacterized coiled-coil DUF342 family protein